MCTAPPLQDAPPGVSGSPAQDNIMLWNAVIFGPPDTIFEVDPKIYTLFLLHACRLRTLLKPSLCSRTAPSS